MNTCSAQSSCGHRSYLRRRRREKIQSDVKSNLSLRTREGTKPDAWRMNQVQGTERSGRRVNNDEVIDHNAPAKRSSNQPLTTRHSSSSWHKRSLLDDLELRISHIVDVDLSVAQSSSSSTSQSSMSSAAVTSASTTSVSAPTSTSVTASTTAPASSTFLSTTFTSPSSNTLSSTSTSPTVSSTTSISSSSPSLMSSSTPFSTSLISPSSTPPLTPNSSSNTVTTSASSTSSISPSTTFTRSSPRIDFDLIIIIGFQDSRLIRIYYAYTIIVLLIHSKYFLYHRLIFES
ncbi:hypothetical protein F5879DRAFT_452772 [Lentinula edodes]|nr:hypothetical protein F5879DRAFT_452772 [Lentinula edodes]